ncbi:MAG TPA: hypothetical protein PLG25_06565 [bacterium]|nr:hypothetical protein [bacterium]HMY34474.1 hypothetical protein [bacterium]HMZ03347.1 hypothetical protein [bacterium]HNB08660.1 hypothetical protein [bacterium]HNB55326.1 hypothetical protein [bacterium]
MSKKFSLALVFYVCFATVKSQDIKNIDEQATALYLKKEYLKCAETFQKAIAADSNYFSAYYNTACCYTLAGKFELSIKFLKQAIDRGFSNERMLKTDPDLNQLRSRDEWKEILEYFHKVRY